MGLGEEKFAGFIAHCLNVCAFPAETFLLLSRIYKKGQSSRTMASAAQREAIAFRTLEMQATLITSNESPVLFRARPFARQSFRACTGVCVPHFALFCPAPAKNNHSLCCCWCVCPSSLQESSSYLDRNKTIALQFINTHRISLRTYSGERMYLS